MECTRCRRVLDKEEFSLRSVKSGIYYVNCDKCRDKLKKHVDKADNQKSQYEDVKKREVIVCECGKTYIAFREYHILRHNSTRWHIKHTS